MYMPFSIKVTQRDPHNLDPYGRPAVIEEITTQCGVQESSKIVKNRNGEEVVSEIQFFLSPHVTVGYADEIVWNDVKKTPVAIELIRNNIGHPRLLVVNC